MKAPRKGYTGYTEAVGKASVRYQKKTYDQVSLRFRKDGDELKKIDHHIQLTGEARTEFIFRAIRETIARDREKAREALKHTLTETVQEPKE